MNRSMRSDEQTFTFTLHKDLIENEEVCPNCKGLGLVIRDNSYGIEGKHGNNHLHMFPYKHQSMTFCPICYNGVIRRCELCGEIIQRGFLRHNCKKQYEIDMLEREKREKERQEQLAASNQELRDKQGLNNPIGRQQYNQNNREINHTDPYQRGKQRDSPGGMGSFEIQVILWRKGL